MPSESHLGSIIFLRHGQAKNNIDKVLAGRTAGVPLTEKGIKQAKTIAKFLKPMKISTVYTSPIERALKTAEIVAKHNSVDCKIDERLIELEHSPQLFIDKKTLESNGALLSIKEFFRYSYDKR